MIIEIKVPSPGESISEVELVAWLVTDGDTINKGQEIAEIDSDKATIAINAEGAGSLHIAVQAGEKVMVGAIIGTIDSDGTSQDVTSKIISTEQKPVQQEVVKSADTSVHISPLAKTISDKNNIDLSKLTPSNSDKKIVKKDVLNFINQHTGNTSKPAFDRPVEVLKMSMLRRKIAERLVAVKNQTAMLTTFNEVDLTGINAIRAKFKDAFLAKHGVKLGYMSFFAKACEMAIQEFPAVNAMIDGENIILFKYVDLSIAVSTPKGLMTPVIRDVQTLSFAEIEIKLAELAAKARDNKISLDDLTGGTFTITNGGTFGSLLSTPILNPPQSAILGMHKIMDRPIVIEGKIEIRPMMYVALSYDHRIIDGKESVSFLVKVKEILESPDNYFFNNEDPGKILMEERKK